ncbi:sugar ABC transporter permease [Caproiciproducens galactitolivorans]|uniref:Lactose transport system permease protein LacF n=1 Tax=Caproiciproducens galactitolivorans TaxID=642589 RepID=A0A4Z0YEK7_9FIRM|nr:sugar ABC transporter permease [Caproiciproducens galactitolivorans]QEY35566.1 sugar ABC transporter permease [Caproiciproducens galactitolivorans]TGJ77293.1 lactose transport system permease protein LacF [Caproiciproducens galactitolivorans]
MKTKNKSMIILFLAPSVLLYLMVFLYPTARTVVMSFFKVEGVTDSVSLWKFNGLGNFKTLFNTPLFVSSLKNIALIWLIGGIGVMVVSLLFGVILTSGVHGKSFFRSVIYLPNVISAVAMGTMWINYVYNPDFGLLSSVLKSIGLSKLAATQWTSPEMVFWSMLVAYCFGMVGYHMLIWMSGIERIPVDYYEAATIEGANVFQRFSKITLPLLKGVCRTNIVLWTVSTMAFFVWSQLFSPVNLSASTVTPMSYMYELVFGASNSAVTVRDSGAGAAIGVILTIVVVVVFMLSQLIVKNDDVEL